MAQRNIDFGTFPDDPNADAIRTAFQKVQENFAELYEGVGKQTVTSVNKTPGAGITVNNSTGNVVVSANIACVQVRTNTLGLGIGANTSQYATISQSSQVLFIDLPANITGISNITASNNINANNFIASSNVSASYISANSAVIGNATANTQFGNGTINASGNANVGNIGANNAVFTGTANITGNITGGNINTGGVVNATGNVSGGNLTTAGVVNATGNGTFGNANLGNLAKANYFQGDGGLLTNVSSILSPTIANGTSNVNIPASNGNVNITAAGNANIVVVTGTGVNIAGTLNTSTGNITGGNLIGPLANGNSNVNIPAANGNVNISSAGNPNILVVTGTGANISGTLNASGNANAGNIGANNGVFTSVSGNGNSLSSIQGANVTGTLSSTTLGNSSLYIGNTSIALNRGTGSQSLTGITSIDGYASTISTNAQPNITSVGTLTGLNVNAAVNANSFTSNIATGTAPLTVTSTTRVANLSVAYANVSDYGVVTTQNTGVYYPVFVSGNSTANYAHASNAVFSANLANGALIATTFVGALSGAATTAGTVTTNAQPNITSVGTLTSLAVTGNITNGNITGGNLISANYLTGTLTTAAQPNITSVGTLSNLSVTSNITSGNANLGNATTSNFFIGTLVTAAQPNITSVGTLSSLSITNNLTAGNIYANSGTIKATTLIGEGGNISNIQGGNVSGAVSSATTAGTVTTNAQPNITSVGILTGLTVGNATANTVFGNGTITAAGNIYANSGTIKATTLIGEGGNISNIQGGNVSGAVSSATTSGTVTTAAQPNITSVGTLSSLSVTGNISSGNANLGNLATANYFQGDGGLLSNITVSAGSYILNGTSNAALAASGNFTVTIAGVSNVLTVTNSNVVANTFVGNLVGVVNTASQTNITSVGNLTSLTVNGAAIFNSTSNLGPVGNITITGGSSNYFLRTDGAGNLSWVNATSLTLAPGSNTQVLFNDTGSFAANVNLSFNKTNGNLSVGGNLNVTKDVVLTTSNISGVNVLTATTLTGTLTAGPQTGINAIGTLTALTVTGTVAAGNFNTSNTATVGVLNANTRIYANDNIIIGSTGSEGGQLILGYVGINGITGQANSTWNLDVDTSNTLRIFTQYANGSVSTPVYFYSANANVSLPGNILVTSGVVASTITSNVSTGTAPFTVTSTTQVANLNVATAGLATYATTANAVAGGNVSGQVSNALVAGTVYTNAQPNITSVGTLTSLTSGTHTISANANIAMSGSLSQISGGNLVSASYLTGTLTTAAQPNITSVGTLSSLSVTGNVSTGNVSGTYGTFTYIKTTGTTGVDLQISGGVQSTANGNGGAINLTSGAGNGTGTGGSLAITAGAADTSGGAGIGNGIGGGVSITGGAGWAGGTGGNVTISSGSSEGYGSNIILGGAGNTTTGAGGTVAINGGLSLGTNKAGSTVTISGGRGTGTGTPGNIAIQVANTAASGATNQTLSNIVVVTPTGITFAANSNISMSGASSQISGGNLVSANFISGNGSSLSSITGANVTGQVGNALVAGTVTTNAQPNITSVGTLTGLNVNAAVNANSFTSNIATGTAPLTVTSTTRVANLSVAYANVSDYGVVTTQNTGVYYPVFVSGSSTANYAHASNTVFSANLANGALLATTFVGALSGAATSATSATTAGTVTTAAQPNITSTGTLTSVTVSGNITAQANVTMTGYVIRSVGTSISAAGSSQGTATAITKEINVVSTVASGAGVVLPTAVAGMVITITNTSANSLLVYPATGGIINSLATNAAFTQPASATLQFIAPTTTQWYTVGATYI
jgi:hypothetical protein